MITLLVHLTYLSPLVAGLAILAGLPARRTAITGTIVEVNTDLADEPQRVNEDPYGEGWLCVLRPADLAELDSLLDAAAYQAILDG